MVRGLPESRYRGQDPGRGCLTGLNASETNAQPKADHERASPPYGDTIMKLGTTTGLALLTLGAAGGRLAENFTHSASEAAASVSARFQDLAAEFGPSVVRVEALRMLGGRMQAIGEGSGFVVEAGGLIMDQPPCDRSGHPRGASPSPVARVTTRSSSAATPIAIWPYCGSRLRSSWLLSCARTARRSSASW